MPAEMLIFLRQFFFFCLQSVVFIERATEKLVNCVNESLVKLHKFNQLLTRKEIKQMLLLYFLPLKFICSLIS